MCFTFASLTRPVQPLRFVSWVCPVTTWPGSVQQRICDRSAVRRMVAVLHSKDRISVICEPRWKVFRNIGARRVDLFLMNSRGVGVWPFLSLRTVPVNCV